MELYFYQATAYDLINHFTTQTFKLFELFGLFSHDKFKSQIF